MTERRDSISCRAITLAESGQFEDWRAIERHLAFTPDAQSARCLFESAAMRYTLDRCCEQSRCRSARGAPPT